MTGKIAFLLEQEVVAREQETLEDEPVDEQYSQRGLVLLDAEAEDGRFLRTIDEYLLTDDEIASMQGRLSVEIAEVEEMHDRIMATRAIRLRVDEELEVESDLENTDVVVPCEPPPPPCETDNDELPVPVFALYLPTITGAAPKADRRLGDRWSRGINVQLGAGEFPLTYSVQLAEYIDDDPVLRLSFEEREATSRAGPLEDIALHLKPQGEWSVRISKDDGLWQEARGQMTFTLRAVYKEFEEDDEEIEVEVLKWENKFTVERIPVTFDDNKISPIAWKAKPSIPEAEKPPLPPKQDRGVKSWWKTIGRSE